jgi:hypothetical protein
MAKFRGIQIKDGAITSSHLVTGITVNGIVISGSAASQRTFTVDTIMQLDGANVSYDLNSFLTRAGGTITGTLTVTGLTTASGGLSVPSGASFNIGSSLSGTDIIQALSGIDSGVTATRLIALTNASTVTGHTHTSASLGIKEERMLTKTATSGTDSINLTFGTANTLSLPTGAASTASDIEAFINGQLLEYDSETGYTVSGSGVTFHSSISGDHLAVVWRTTGSSAGGGGGGGGGGLETLTITRTSMESGINASLLPFTTAEVGIAADWLQFATQGVIPYSHYNTWLVHGKNMMLDLIAKSNNPYYRPFSNFGLADYLDPLTATGTNPLNLTSAQLKEWAMPMIGLCAAWLWQTKYSRHTTNITGIINPVVWKYLSDANESFLNPAEGSGSSLHAKLRLTNSKWMSTYSKHPYEHSEAPYFMFAGKRFKNSPETLYPHIDRNWRSSPWDAGGSPRTRINHYDTMMRTGIAFAGITPFFGEADVAGIINVSVEQGFNLNYYRASGYKGLYLTTSGAQGVLTDGSHNQLTGFLVPRFVQYAHYLYTNANDVAGGSSSTVVNNWSSFTNDTRNLIIRHLNTLRSPGASYSYNAYGSSLDYDKLPTSISQLKDYPTVSGLIFDGSGSYSFSYIPTTNSDGIIPNSYLDYQPDYHDSYIQNVDGNATLINVDRTYIYVAGVGGVAHSESVVPTQTYKIDGYIGDVSLNFDS